ncbi:hypothetical protein ACIP93_00535 [Streptomyces sp. NPDC088745]|uniref:hypothetical protein n=1 Tax=Streptomyces sp. NPDC088745 TaxID=3365884 RepID=UPI003811E446
MTPAPGTVVVDERDGRVGVLMGRKGPYVRLRPLAGGREWDVPPERVRTASTTERIRAGVAAANEHSRALR